MCSSSADRSPQQCNSRASTVVATDRREKTGPQAGIWTVRGAIPALEDGSGRGTLSPVLQACPQQFVVGRSQRLRQLGDHWGQL